MIQEAHIVKHVAPPIQYEVNIREKKKILSFCIHDVQTYHLFKEDWQH